MLRRLHYDHHVYPDDLKLLFLPVWFSIPSFTIYLLIAYGITKSVTIALSFGIGMIIMRSFTNGNIILLIDRFVPSLSLEDG